MFKIMNLSAGTGDAAKDALTSAFTSVAAEITGTVLAVLPIALGVLGLVIAITFGVGFFRRILSR